ncbi:MAG: hypothetical protein ACNA8W_19935, partial [Bradymonadaceae bacterium]
NCAKTSRLGDWTDVEIRQILNVVDQAGRPLEVVGSASRSERRGVGSDLPVGKGPNTRSDIDYMRPHSSAGYFDGLESLLPAIDPTHPILGGVHNPFMGPGIRFEPGTPPYYVPGK